MTWNGPLTSSALSQNTTNKICTFTAELLRKLHRRHVARGVSRISNQAAGCLREILAIPLTHLRRCFPKASPPADLTQAFQSVEKRNSTSFRRRGFIRFRIPRRPISPRIALRANQIGDATKRPLRKSRRHRIAIIFSRVGQETRIPRPAEVFHIRWRSLTITGRESSTLLAIAGPELSADRTIVMLRARTTDLRKLAIEMGYAIERSSNRDRIRLLSPDRTYVVDPRTGAAAFSPKAALAYLLGRTQNSRRHQAWHAS